MGGDTMDGLVKHLLIKPGRKIKMVGVEKLELITKLGIKNDVNANPLSPRQILIIDSKILCETGLNPGDLKENIVVDNLDLTKVNSGDVLTIGPTSIRISFLCETCSYICNLNSINLSQDLKLNRGKLGIVINGGVIEKGNKVKLIKNKYEIFPDNFYERFCYIVNKIPVGNVIDYKTLLTVIGGAKSYYRVFPRFIEKNLITLPCHRILTSNGSVNKKVTDQVDLLEKEGVKTKNGFVDLSTYLWDVKNLYLNKT